MTSRARVQELERLYANEAKLVKDLTEVPHELLWLVALLTQHQANDDLQRQCKALHEQNARLTNGDAMVSSCAALALYVCVVCGV
jgi:hypothetical protein